MSADSQALPNVFPHGQFAQIDAPQKVPMTDSDQRQISGKQKPGDNSPNNAANDPTPQSATACRLPVLPRHLPRKLDYLRHGSNREQN